MCGECGKPGRDSHERKRGHVIDVVLFDNEKHLELFRLWWSEQEGYSVPDDLMPEVSLAVEVDGAPVGAGCLIKTDTGACMFEYVCMSPEVRGEKRKECLRALIETAKHTGKLLGFSKIVVFTASASLASRFKASGFKSAKHTYECLTSDIKGA